MLMANFESAGITDSACERSYPLEKFYSPRFCSILNTEITKKKKKKS